MNIKKTQGLSSTDTIKLWSWHRSAFCQFVYNNFFISLERGRNIYSLSSLLPTLLISYSELTVTVQNECEFILFLFRMCEGLHGFWVLLSAVCQRLRRRWDSAERIKRKERDSLRELA